MSDGQVTEGHVDYVCVSVRTLAVAAKRGYAAHPINAIVNDMWEEIQRLRSAAPNTEGESA